MIRITSLFVVALAAHSLGQAAAWSGCAASYASEDCSGEPTVNTTGCGSVNVGCEKDTDSGTWGKVVSTAGTCVDGAVINISNNNADEAACDLSNTTIVHTIGACKVNGYPGTGYASTKYTCQSSAATTTASAVLVLLAAVASHMF